MGAESKVFSHFEVSAHNTPEDCWVIINAKCPDRRASGLKYLDGFGYFAKRSVYAVVELEFFSSGSYVYNVTSYLNEHPGGDDVILATAGKDASQEFEDVGHGSAARLMLDEFYVGEVDPSNKPSVDSKPVFVEAANGKSKSPADNRLLYFMLALALIAFGAGIQLYNLSSQS